MVNYGLGRHTQIFTINHTVKISESPRLYAYTHNAKRFTLSNRPVKRRPFKHAIPVLYLHQKEA
jgi:hypothetical protein